MSKRKTYSAKQKKKIALEAVKEQLTAAEIARKYQVHPSQVNAWKKVLLNDSEVLFEHGNKRSAASAYTDKERDNLLRIIGQLQVENDFLKKTLS